MNYQNKKVLILGLGINQGGLGATKFFADAGALVKVTDLKTETELQDSLKELKKYPNIEYVLGEHKYEDIDWAEIIVRNPAVKPNNPYLLYAKEHNKQIEMDLSIFFEFVDPKQVIGITGSKGKSTTASLIYLSLEENGVEVILAGNIGKSMLDTIPFIKEGTVVILELSSFQLQALQDKKVSPHWSIITNIFPEHLNYHTDMEEYIGAKRLITQFQTQDDFLFLNKDDKTLNNPEFTKNLKSQIIYFSKSDLPDNPEIKLPGEHNLENLACTIQVAETFNISEDQVIKAVKDFEGVEFRLQLIKEVNGVKVYNDSAATNPNATIEALKSFPNSILITGGMNKGLLYHDLAQVIDTNAKSVYFIEGDATEDLKKEIKKQDKIVGTYNDLEVLLKEVLGKSKSGDIILFSPGATSFNFWQNEFDRGRKFNQAVEEITSGHLKP